MWQSISARSATRACAAAIFWVLLLPNVLIFLLAGLVGMFADDPGDFTLLFLASGFVIGLLTDVTACVLAMIWVSDGFRAAAAGENRRRPRHNLSNHFSSIPTGLG